MAPVIILAFCLVVWFYRAYKLYSIIFYHQIIIKGYRLFRLYIASFVIENLLLHYKDKKYPKMFKLVKFDNNSFRSNMFSEQDICTWISIHSKNTNTSWCVNNKLSNSESSRFICR